MKILHISPTFFDNRSFIGGAERFAYELAKAQSRKFETVLMTFSAQKSLSQEGNLKIQYLTGHFPFLSHPVITNPLTGTFLRWIRWADIVHCHQPHTFSSDAGILFSKIFRKKVFFSDLGGGHPYSVSSFLPLLKTANAGLLISQYSKKLWEEMAGRPKRLEVIYGGIDPEKFHPSANPARDFVLYAGRLIPHKGIDYLIDAVDNTFRLEVVGRPYHQSYFELLKNKSKDKKVSFVLDASDELLSLKYQNAMVTVLPSVYKNHYGQHSLIPELLGLTVLESMACATPVIVTDVASLPEIVEDGVTGFVIPPNHPAALREKIHFLLNHPEKIAVMGAKARESVLRKFTWDETAERCFAIYEK